MKNKNILIVLLLIVLVLIGLFIKKDISLKDNNESINRDLFLTLDKEKSEFLGDISNTSYIVSLLRSPSKNIIQKFISLDTDKDKNELNIYYEPEKNYELKESPYGNLNKEVYEKNSLILFYGINNLNKINYYYRKNPSEDELNKNEYTVITSISKKDMQNKYSDFETITKDIERLKEIILK